jgi:hypothetical protein
VWFPHSPNYRIIVAALLLQLGSAPGPSLAAAPIGAVEGVVKDALQRPIPGAELRLEASDGRVVGRTVADEQGRFTFTGIVPGTYVVVGTKDGFETATSVVTVSAEAGGSVELALASKKPLDVQVATKRLEEARISIQPRIGASTYEIPKEVIQNQPGGDNRTLSQVLLQAPGVTQDTTAQGAIHVRNEHANVQYRINGVALPEGVSLFGQNGGLSTRLANSVELITGALPAEYGLRTSGIVDVQTKSGVFEKGGYVGMYGGSHSWLQPSGEYRGSVGRFNYYVSGDYLENNIGITQATPDDPIHDQTKQGHAFGYFEYLIDATSKVSAIFGVFVGHFQIPNSKDQVPSLGLTVNGISDFDSAKSRETQFEQNYYSVLSFLKAEQDLTYQVSVYSRWSTVTFRPDPLSDILFNGVAQDFHRSSIATGLQTEGSYVLTPTHTVRAGIIVSAERTSVQTSSAVVSTDPAAPDTPFTIFESSGKTGYSYSTYAQDAWKIVPTVTINGGLRFDYYAGFRNEWDLSPRLNVVWQATPMTTVHAGYAHYFTPPPLVFTSTSDFSKFVGTSNEAAVTKNATIKAERANYFDAGVIQQIMPGLKVGLDVYYKVADDQLDDGQFGAPVFITPFNYKHGYRLLRHGQLLRLRQSGGRRAEGEAHRDRAIAHPPGRPRLQLPPLHCHGSRPAHHGLRGGVVPLGVDGHAVQPGLSCRERAAAHRHPRERHDRAVLPAGQPWHLPTLHATGLRENGGAVRYHQSVGRAVQDPRRHGARGLRAPVRATARFLRRNQERILSVSAAVGIMLA